MDTLENIDTASKLGEGYIGAQKIEIECSSYLEHVCSKLHLASTSPRACYKSSTALVVSQRRASKMFS